MPLPVTVARALPKPYYQQGGISIYHADAKDLLPLIPVGLVSLVLTDPPYGIAWDTDYRRFSGGAEAERSAYEAISNDQEPFDPLPLMRFKRQVLFGANAFSNKLPLGSWLVWDKRAAGGEKAVLSDGEVAWYSEGHGVYIFSHTWDGFNRASERGSKLHPTQKPVMLMRWIINRWTKPGDLVLDPFMGSGPVAAACQQLGRRYVGIELVEEYCRAAVGRLALD